MEDISFIIQPCVTSVGGKNAENLGFKRRHYRAFIRAKPCKMVQMLSRCWRAPSPGKGNSPKLSILKGLCHCTFANAESSSRIRAVKAWNSSKTMRNDRSGCPVKVHCLRNLTIQGESCSMKENQELPVREVISCQ